jgi:hypothetical protein
LEKQDESKVLFAVSALVFDLAETLLVQRGILVPTENAYFQLAQQAAGLDSEWTCQFRLAAALDPLPVDASLYESRGIAAMHLYHLSADLLRGILRPDDASTVERSIAFIAQAGYK